MTIAMELFEVRIDETSNEQIIILREKHGQRLLPIVIGMFEAQSIHVKINNIPLPRPLTHDLLISVIEGLNARLVRVLINKLEENTFYARLFLRTDQGEIDLDSRPSDAIALAIRADVPIFCSEQVFEALSGE